jgi:hypothetical protein
MSVTSSRDATSRDQRGEAALGWRKTWWRRLSRTWQALARDNISIMAAGAAYYSMLSIFPAMSALVLTYGLIADPMTIEYHIDVLAGVLPAEALKLVADQLHALVTAPSNKLGIGLILSVLFALWTAVSATTAMMNALTVAYRGQERRGLLRFYGIAIALTIGFTLFSLAALVLIAGVPAVMTEIPEPLPWDALVPQLRWPLLALMVLSLRAEQGATDLGLFACRHNLREPLVARRLGGIFVLCLAFRIVRPDLRVARRGRHPDGVALRHRLRHSCGRRAQPRDRACRVCRGTAFQGVDKITDLPVAARGQGALLSKTATGKCAKSSTAAMRSRSA